MMRRRSFSSYGLEVKRVRLLLTREQWFRLGELADRYHQSVPRQIEQAIRYDLVKERTIDDAIQGVYHDAQGREHEDPDARAMSEVQE
jgi:predicted transcriptional regulator